MDTPTLRADAPVSERALDKPPAAQPQLLERRVEGEHESIDHLAGPAAPQVKRMQAAVSGTDRLLHDRADQAPAPRRQWVGGLRGTVREHPLAAVVTAMAAGALVARLMRSEH